MARQYTGPSRRSLEDIDIVLPFGTIMELICYVGLLKVAEQIKNPFGDADEDFDLNFLITRHLRVSYLQFSVYINRNHFRFLIKIYCNRRFILDSISLAMFVHQGWRKIIQKKTLPNQWIIWFS
jgi:hypothetical protein